MATLRIGLTGGIGSGKSTVANCWASLGGDLIDTDAIARALTSPGGAGIAELRREFGTEAIDPHGALDRERMRERAFTDPMSKRRLERILHPLIGAEALRRADQSTAAAIVFDVPLLSETSSWRARCDRIVVVDCSEQTQVQRVMRRSGWEADQVRRVIAQQLPRASRRSIADAIIDNDNANTLAQLHIAAHGLWALWVTG